MNVVLLVFLLLFLPWSGISHAALGPHDVTATTGSTEGACAECHNVAQTAMTRGWGRSTAEAPTTGWYSQPITVLCWTCHSSGNSVGAHDVSSTAMDTSNHSYVIANAPPGALDPKTRDTASAVGSNLPYTATGNLQCTSCHNAHNDQNRPFLSKPDVIQMCDACHPRRNTSEVRAANVGVGGDDISLHPVDIPMADQTGGYTSIKTVAAMDNALKTGLNPDNTWRLGGKLSAGGTGNISCGTCHAVHGPAGGGGGVNDLLAIDNKSGDSSSLSNPLCGGCHLGGLAGGSVGTSGTGDHPMDDDSGRVFYPGGVVIPDEWTVASGRIDRGASVFNANGTPRCSSCHDAHGGQGGTSLLYDPPPAKASTDWCFSCHHAAPEAHHSAQGLEEGFVSAIGCASCHAGGSNSHNHSGEYFASFIQENVPAGGFTTARGRSVTKEEVGSNTDSALCLFCHRDDDPLNWRPVYGHSDNEVMNPMPNVHGVKRGGSSHYLGPDTDLIISGNATPVVATLFTESWASDNSAYSKYGNSTGGGSVPPVVNSGSTVICESCHNVLYNDGAIHPSTYPNRVTAGWSTNLLLKPYEDDPSGLGNGNNEYAIGSELCLGCHGELPAKHHPNTGDTLTAGPRAGNTLITGAGSYANQTNAPIGGGPAPGTLSYPDVDNMDCDSCHRPHSGNSYSTVTGSGKYSRTNVYLILELDAPGNDWSVSLCVECHKH